MSRRALTSTLALAIILSASLAHARNWTIATRNGTMRFEADLVEVQGDKVIIQASGKKYQVSFRTLSAADQEFIRSQQAGKNAQAGADAAQAPSTEGTSQPAFTLDFQQTGSGASQTFEVLATPVPAEACLATTLSPDGKYVAWIQEQPKADDGKKTDFGVVLYNIETRESQTLTAAPHFATVPNGRLWGLVFSKDSSILTAVTCDRILRYAIRNNKAEQLSAVAISSILENIKTSLASQEFDKDDLDNDYALACDGEYVMFGNYYEGICLCKTDDGSVVSSLAKNFCESDEFWLSGDCRTLVFQVKQRKELGAMNLVSGKNIDSAFARSWQGVAVSPSGKYVVMSDDELVSVYGLEEGLYQLVKTIPVESTVHEERLTINDDGVICFDKCIIDIDGPDGDECHYFRSFECFDPPIMAATKGFVVVEPDSNDPARMYAFPSGQILYEVPNTTDADGQWLCEISNDGNTVLVRPDGGKSRSLTILKSVEARVIFSKAEIPFPPNMDVICRIDYSIDGKRLTVFGTDPRKFDAVGIAQYCLPTEDKTSGTYKHCTPFLRENNRDVRVEHEGFSTAVCSQTQREVYLVDTAKFTNYLFMVVTGQVARREFDPEFCWLPDSDTTLHGTRLFDWCVELHGNERLPNPPVVCYSENEFFVFNSWSERSDQTKAGAEAGKFTPNSPIEHTDEFPLVVRPEGIAISPGRRWFVALNSAGLAKHNPNGFPGRLTVIQDRDGHDNNGAPREPNTFKLDLSTPLAQSGDCVFHGSDQELLRIRSRGRDDLYMKYTDISRDKKSPSSIELANGMSVAVINLKLGKRVWQQHTKYPMDAAPERGFYVTAEDGRTLTARSMDDDQVLANIGATDAAVTMLTLSRDAARLAVATLDKKLTIWDLSGICETRQNPPATETATP